MMDFQNVLGYVLAFFQDGRVGTIGGLILIDVVFGIAKSIKVGQFEWKKVGQFYQTNVLPYVLGYLALFIGAKFISADWVGPAQWLVADGAIWAVWAAIVVSLAASILESVKVLGYGIGPDN